MIANRPYGLLNRKGGFDFARIKRTSNALLRT